MPSSIVTIAAVLIAIFLAASALTKIYPQTSTSNQAIEGSVVSGIQYTPLEQDALIVNKTGLAGMDWFIHNKVSVTAGASGPLTPIMVYGQERDFRIVDGTVGPSGIIFSCPNLKQVFFPQAVYIWIDANGDAKARIMVGYTSQSGRIYTALTVIKLTEEKITVSANGQSASIPASTQSPQHAQIGIQGTSSPFPLDWGYPGGWPTPSNDIRGSPTGPLADAAANLQVIEHQIVPYSESYAGDFVLPNYFAYGNSNSQAYLFTVKLRPMFQCPDAGCPLYADTHGAVKLTLNADGSISYYLVDGPSVGWTVKYGSTVIHEFPSPSCLQESCVNPDNAIFGLLPSQATTTTIPGSTTTIPVTSTSTTMPTTTTTIPTTTTVSTTSTTTPPTTSSTTAQSTTTIPVTSTKASTTTTALVTTTIHPSTTIQTTTTSSTAIKSTTTTTIVPSAQPCRTFDIPCWIGYYFLRIFGLRK